MRGFWRGLFLTIAAIGAWWVFAPQPAKHNVAGAQTVIRVRGVGGRTTRVAGFVIGDEHRSVARFAARTTPFELVVPDDEVRGTFVAWGRAPIAVEVIRVTKTGERSHAIGWARVISAFHRADHTGVRTL
jgi:hypothetical protein